LCVDGLEDSEGDFPDPERNLESYLSSIGETAIEVTVGQYRRCVDAGHCSAPKNEHDHDADATGSRFI